MAHVFEPDYFTYATGLKMLDGPKWRGYLVYDSVKPEDPLTVQHGNLALAIQLVTEECVINICREAKINRL
jgi:carbamoyltransferase